MTKDELLRKTARELREKKIPSVDGSYVVCIERESKAFAAVCHPAITPKQIAVEAELRKRGLVYFIRDKSLPAPYWISPYRQAIRRVEVKRKDTGEMVVATLPHVVFSVATSRDARKSEAVEVATPTALLQTMKSEEERAYLLEQMRKAVAMLLSAAPAAA